MKKLIFNSKKSKYEQSSNLIKELVFYEIDVKNSIRIINILDNVYIFLVSSNSSTLLKEIKSEEELEDLKLKLSKINNSAKKDSFKSIFKKMLLKKEDIAFSGNDYVKLEKKIETSLKDKQDRLKNFRGFILRKCFNFFLFFSITSLSFAQTKSLQATKGLNFPFSNFENIGGSEIAFSLQLLILLTIITLSPAFLVLMTSFLRISIVLDFIRRALSLQQSPPTQIVMGLALF